MTLFEVIMALVMLVGLAGTVIPYFPGILLILGAALAWALVEAVGSDGWILVGLLAFVGLSALLVSTLLPLKTTAGEGAPRWVFAVGLAGVVVGFFVIPVAGALLGGPIAILLAEVYRLRDLERAWASTIGALKGIGLGLIIEFLTAFAMIAAWVLFVLLA